MEIDDLLHWLKTHKVCYLATIDDTGPRVRCMTLDRAEHSGLYFHMPVQKAVFQQIAKNPNVEVCFVDLAEGIQIRILGSLERDFSQESQDIFMGLYPQLAPNLALHGFDSMALMRLANGCVEVQKDGLKTQIQL